MNYPGNGRLSLSLFSHDSLRSAFEMTLHSILLFLESHFDIVHALPSDPKLPGCLDLIGCLERSEATDIVKYYFLHGTPSAPQHKRALAVNCWELWFLLAAFEYLLELIHDGKISAVQPEGHVVESAIKKWADSDVHKLMAKSFARGPLDEEMSRLVPLFRALNQEGKVFWPNDILPHPRGRPGPKSHQLQAGALALLVYQHRNNALPEGKTFQEHHTAYKGLQPTHNLEVSDPFFNVNHAGLLLIEHHDNIFDAEILCLNGLQDGRSALESSHIVRFQSVIHDGEELHLAGVIAVDISPSSLKHAAQQLCAEFQATFACISLIRCYFTQP
jgi:hypothetical protein